MKIFIARGHDGESTGIYGVFTSKERAEEEIDVCLNIEEDRHGGPLFVTYDIIENGLNEPMGHHIKHVYKVFE